MAISCLYHSRSTHRVCHLYNTLSWQYLPNYFFPLYVLDIHWLFTCLKRIDLKQIYNIGRHYKYAFHISICIHENGYGTTILHPPRLMAPLPLDMLHLHSLFLLGFSKIYIQQVWQPPSCDRLHSEHRKILLRNLPISDILLCYHQYFCW